MPPLPQSSIEWIFNVKTGFNCWDVVTLFSLPKFSVGLKYAKNALAAAGSSRRSSRCFSDPLVGWGGGHPLPIVHPSAPSAPRFSRLWRSACAPNVKSWLHPCSTQPSTDLTTGQSCRQSKEMCMDLPNNADIVSSPAHNLQVIIIHNYLICCMGVLCSWVKL